ncbi:HutD/Ves family protein [Desulfotignum balticum]|uniref:HutD/Ves family protein n=1 Tax=Desulfotignum balticum TaxID=115781 RepID=UPI0003FA5B95|nr:HutD family protein [Desulfotignum balticum]
MVLEYQIIGPEDFKELPWKNGQGTTVELRVCRGDTGEGFFWRLSRAHVCSDGPFSDFSGYDRILVLLAGKGMDLFHEESEGCQLSRAFDRVKFSGDWKTRAFLKDGPIEDFNIMTKQGHCTAKVDVFTSFGENQLAVDAREFLVYAPDHAISMNGLDSKNILLPKGHLFDLKGPVALPWKIKGEGVICIQIRAF